MDADFGRTEPEACIRHKQPDGTVIDNNKVINDVTGMKYDTADEWINDRKKLAGRNTTRVANSK
ncbi:hypothetical protein [Planctomicrobium sp. SH527]|uniref:hypothetical protein n=1 Tax=Planctomicrobium sp. SH527 TaxID=3448123 RepID=UPI003F5B4710